MSNQQQGGIGSDSMKSQQQHDEDGFEEGNGLKGGGRVQGRGRDGEEGGVSEVVMVAKMRKQQEMVTKPATQQPETATKQKKTENNKNIDDPGCCHRKSAELGVTVAAGAGAGAWPTESCVGGGDDSDNPSLGASAASTSVDLMMAITATTKIINGPSSAGRKGDPRMHRAVAARIVDPTLSLYDALKIGGFHYPHMDDATRVDDENITLAQRKNQLSRRVRVAKKKHLRLPVPPSPLMPPPPPPQMLQQPQQQSASNHETIPPAPPVMPPPPSPPPPQMQPQPQQQSASNHVSLQTAATSLSTTSSTSGNDCQQQKQQQQQQFLKHVLQPEPPPKRYSSTKHTSVNGTSHLVRKRKKMKSPDDENSQHHHGPDDTNEEALDDADTYDDADGTDASCGGVIFDVAGAVPMVVSKKLSGGKRGDPRMYRAVAARLADPNIPLFYALKIGGFNYKDDLDASCVDDENVSLGQRRNQLSRRIRLARRQPKQQLRVSRIRLPPPPPP